MPSNPFIKSCFLITVILIIGIIIRLYALEKNELILEGDEAIVALMAKHISENKIIPAFVYGQDYMGSLEAYTVSIFFSFIDNSIKTLKSAPLAYSIISILFLWLLLKNEFGIYIAAAVSLLCAAPPYLMIKWSLSPTGGHIENFLLSIIIMIFIKKYFHEEKFLHLALACFFCGLAFWVNPFSIFLTISFLIIYFHHKKNNPQKYIFSIFIFLFFFSAGALPLIIYNINHNGITFLKLGCFFLGVSASTYNSGNNIFQLVFNKIISM
ncbi:glycosyltransferase family 39 protein, partial [Candidatus Dependentiae bacterium]|nr:glycosyltransferase family 39 protein [Candidatus Dependentiae bacterium]